MSGGSSADHRSMQLRGHPDREHSEDARADPRRVIREEVVKGTRGDLVSATPPSSAKEAAVLTSIQYAYADRSVDRSKPVLTM